MKEAKDKIKDVLSDKVTLGYSLLRSAHFALQGLSLPFVEVASTKKSKKVLPDPQHMKQAALSLFQLLKKDSENIKNGLYPKDVLKPEPLMKHFLRFPQILMDGYEVSRRRDKQISHDFSNETEDLLKELPEYYQRNFHFQSDGYLTDKSADLYEHQVEILFSGAGDAMRRLLIPLMKNHFAGQGEGLHFLEVAAGTGRLTRFVKLAFPKAKITVLDLSWPYLKKAQANLADFSRIDFIQGKAEDLPFQADAFDAVFSCYLFHELPFEIRRKVVLETARVLKPGGIMGLVDSVQKEDAGDFSWALEQFPRDFHEPFYKNYISNPVEGMMLYAGFTDILKDQGFLSKAVTGIKPLST
jgi:Methylase involved in ubiquinone/menaquinone biosynthesis